MRRLLLLAGALLAVAALPDRAAHAQSMPVDTVRATASPADVQRVRRRIGTLRGRRVRQVVQPVYIIVPTPAEAGAPGASVAAPVPTEVVTEGSRVSRGIPPGTTLPAGPPGVITGRPGSPEPATPSPRIDRPRLPDQPSPLPQAQIAPESLVREVERVLLDVGLLRAVGIHFAFDRADLFDGEDRTLDAVGDVLNRHPDLRLAIGGHTDAVGGPAYNLRLSDARAATVRRYLIQRWNVAPERLTAQGFGEAQPVAANTSDMGRARNRRVEFQVVE